MEWWSKGGIAQSEILADLCEDLRVYHHISDAANQKALVAWILKQKQHASDDE